MDFKGSSIYYTFSSDFTDTNNISYFPYQVIRAGFANQDLWEQEYQPNPNLNLDFLHLIQRELEKERIRAKLIAEERRKLLEDEVRREMTMGRVSRFDSTMLFEHREIGLCESLPFQRDPAFAVGGGALPSGLKLKEIKDFKGSILELNKDKVAFLAKPNATDLKRKTTTSPIVAPVDQSAGLKKPKFEYDWSCALCHITAPNERALKEHLKGKKHKSRLSGLSSQRTVLVNHHKKADSYSLASPINVPRAINSPILEDGKGTGKSLLGKVDKPASLVLPVIGQKNTLMKEFQIPVVKREIGEASLEAVSTMLKEKFKYFCEMCQVGVDSLEVMNAHKRGKRHVANSKKCNKTNESSAEIRMVEKYMGNMEPGMASILERDAVEEEEMDISVADGPLEKVVVEEQKGMDICVDETKVEQDKTESSKENIDYDVKEKFKYLCETCQVGADLLVMMNFHKRGKRHLEKSKKCNKTDEILAGKSVVEKNKGRVEQCMVEEEKKMDISVNRSLDLVAVEEEKGIVMCVAQEPEVEEQEDELERSKESNDYDVKGKFKYYCETCQVGVDSLRVMNAHKRGKRHRAKSKECNKTGVISIEKSTVEKNKGNIELDMASSLEKGVVEEVMKMDTCAAKELKVERQEDDVGSSKESNDYDVVRVVEEKGMLLEGKGELAGMENFEVIDVQFWW